LFTRTRYQNGSLRVKKRGNGLKVWEFRYYEPLPEGNGRALRAVTVGTLQEYPTEAAARKLDVVQSIILRINAGHTLGPVTASTVGALIARYEKEELPARYSTQARTSHIWTTIFVRGGERRLSPASRRWWLRIG
jgi:integrase